MTGMEELKQRLVTAVTAMQTAYNQYDIAVGLLHQVVERTGNFREYYFSSVKLKELERALNYRMFTAPLIDQSIEDLFEMLEHGTRDINNLAATYITEADRIDAIGPVA